ncbi:SGNH/GDSL hydrolase family protein [Zobellella denitrificans]|nr:SGNH/GDSL hydrolase family protein [Zobellella denitrificans]
MVKQWVLSVLVLALLMPAWATPVGVERIVAFGTSLSDPGNAFALTGQTSTPPYARLDPFLVPDAPYAKGGQHFSNGATWLEQFARPQGLAGSVRPALLGASAGAGNYAVGGARARDDGINASLPLLIELFLHDVDGVAPEDALYVVEMGANDVRDALLAALGGGDGGAVLAEALAIIGDGIGTLYAAGARRFLVLNTPDLALLPATRLLAGPADEVLVVASLLTGGFNDGLNGLLLGLATLPGIELRLLDVHQQVNALVTDPGSFGLREVEAACLTPKEPPFACLQPDEYLFWDGIHPTRAVHALLAHAAAGVLAVP